MKHLVKSFQQYRSLRGVHFYDSEHCTFLPWMDVIKFVDSLPKRENIDPFSERLEQTLANYDPDTEFLAVQQNGDAVSVELYTQAQ